MHSLSFDGASKGNPGEASGGGFLLDPSGMPVVSYSWGLDIETNNMAEELALLQGLSLAVSKSIQNLVVFRDSKIIIQALKMRMRPNNLKLSQMLRKLTLLLHNFKEVKFYDILWGLNTQSNFEANSGVTMDKAKLLVNVIEMFSPIP